MAENKRRFENGAERPAKRSNFAEEDAMDEVDRMLDEEDDDAVANMAFMDIPDDATVQVPQESLRQTWLRPDCPNINPSVDTIGVAH